MARAKWMSARESELLPVPYFHVVFTLPQQIGALALQNAREIYNILFRAAAETLLTISADPKRLGASVGFLAVLLTRGNAVPVYLSWIRPTLLLRLWSMGAESASSSASALRRSGRRHQPGRRRVDWLPDTVVPAPHRCVEKPLPERVPDLSSRSV